jgi:ribonucleoside-diphosphate reductase alpha chain
MVRIVTEEGYTHKVTPDHKVGVVGGLQKEAQNLSEGDRIELQQKEGLFGPNDMEDEAFLVGLIAADGGIGETAYIDIWQDKTLHLAHEIEGVCARVLEKYENILDYDNHPQTGRSSVLPYRKPTFGETTKPSTQKRRLTSTALKVVLEHLGITAETKLQVPEFVWEGNKKTVQAYIRGAILCDGSPQATEEITTVQWGSISQTWLEEIQILLINLGIKSSIKPMREAGENLLPDGKGGHKLYSVQKLYRLLITSVPACKLLEEATHLGKERNHLQYLHNLQTKEGYTQKMHATFSHLEPLPNEDAYCLQVDSEEHLWVVNGILTRNTEIFLNTSPSKVDPVTHGITEPGEWAVCNLGSINLVKHLHEGKIDKTKLKNTVRTAIRMLDNVIDINFYPIWEAEVANKRHRPIGLGVMGFHSTIMENNIAFDSPEAVEVADVYQELISLYAIEASSDLAVERGSYQSFKGSKWDRGLLPLDTIALLKQERGEQWCSIDESSQFPQEWERIREKIKTQGMRNSNTMAIAPTATISNICGVSEGIMPEASAIYRKENLSGGFPIVNKILVRKLKSLGLWEGEIIEAIKIADGSIQHISAIPEDVRRVYKTQFEIDPAYLIECASRRQKWIDMGQSLNLYIDKPNGRKLSNMYLLAWAKGLKSTYYLRSSGASQREKTSVEVQKTPEAQACSIEAARRGEVCEACQ